MHLDTSGCSPSIRQSTRRVQYFPLKPREFQGSPKRQQVNFSQHASHLGLRVETPNSEDIIEDSERKANAIVHEQIGKHNPKHISQNTRLYK